MYTTLIFLAVLASAYTQLADPSQPKAPYPPCTTAEGQSGVCVSIYLCVNNTIVTDGSHIVDERFQITFCSVDTLCCPLSNVTPPAMTPPAVTLPAVKPPAVTSPAVTPPTVTPPPAVRLPPAVTTTSTALTPTIGQEREGCGWRNPDGLGTQSGGDVGETKFGEFPWMVVILKVGDNGVLDYVGGGSLIHWSAVLTVAHYVSARPRLRVRAGEWDMKNTQEIHPHQDRDVQSIEIHEDYNEGPLFYDVAILFLKSPMRPMPNVGLVCLPALDERVLPNTRCFAAGWGKDKFEKEANFKVVLKKVEVPVVGRGACEERLTQTRLGALFKLHSSFMCAGGESGVDTCTGDGGSPLVCPNEYEEDRYVQAGIVSWGIGCGQDGTPGVYLDVSCVRDWIDNQIAAKNYNIKAYEL